MKSLYPALLILLLYTPNFNVRTQELHPPVTKINSKNDLSGDTSLSLPGQLSSFKFEHLTAADGLSHNKVQCILQDKQCYIWFGTINGLNRYDGYSFKVFVNIPGDTSTIATNDITCLYQDKEGLIWVGTATSAFSSYNPKTETFKNYFLPPLKGLIHDFKEDETGLLWLATGTGLFSFDKRSNNPPVYHATDDSARENIHGILKDRNKDILWLSTETGIRKFNKKTGNVKPYKIPSPAFSDISREITHNIIQDRHGDIWMTTSDQGVYRLDPVTGKVTAYPTAVDGSSSLKIGATTQLMEDTDGKIWIGGQRLAFFDRSKESISFSRIDINDAQGIPGKIRALIKDSTGIYWIGTERGIAKYDPKLYSFKTIPANPPYTLPGVITILEDKDNNFWFGNYLGIGQFDPNTGIYTKNEALGIKEPVYSSILDKNGSMWYGSAGCLFHVYKKNNGSQQSGFISERIQLPLAKKIRVWALALGPDGILWIGTRGEGILSYNPSLNVFALYRGEKTTQQLYSANDILVLHVISADSILIGTEGRGLMLLHGKTGKFKKITFEKNETPSIDYSVINAICNDDKGNIWIGTENGGLWQTDVSFSTFKNYSIKDGLQSTEIAQIIEDDIGQVWLNTKLGLEIIDPVRKRFVQYSEKDGLNIDELGYLIKKASGELMRVDLNGLHIFHSSSINLNKQAPPVYINHLKILDKEIPVFNDTTIRIKYNQNYVAFDYVALNYTQSFKNKYIYRLTNLDENWINAGERRFVSYANIAPGNYTFQVKACNNNGIWNDKPARLTLIVDPPWWQRWWFYTLVALAAAGAVYALFQLRLQQKMKAFELRNAISRDLHDEVGSTLSSISFLSSMALNDVEGNNGKVHKTLTSISESSHKMLDAMNDIIWSIQPQNDTLNNIIARMVAFASELLEARKISLHYHTGNNLKNLHLGVGIRHDFFVIFKEAVNNLAKYSEATEADINLEYLQPHIILTIRDNGKGFDPKIVRNGNGLKNMRKRAEKIGAKYQLNSVPGQGTIITLQIKPM